MITFSVQIYFKVKFILEQATKAQRGSRGIALLFLQPRRYMGMYGQRHAPAALPPRISRYPLHRRLGGPQDRSGRVRKTSSPTGIRSLDRAARSRSLYRLKYLGPRKYICSSLDIRRNHVIRCDSTPTDCYVDVHYRQIRSLIHYVTQTCCNERDSPEQQFKTSKSLPTTLSRLYLHIQLATEIMNTNSGPLSLSFCVCVCVCVCVCARARARARVCVRERVRARVKNCSRLNER
jgi:hypothetical protein